MDQTAHDPPPQQGAVSRRRVVQACSTCRARKIRCDAGVPKCSLCVSLNVECVYLDSQYSKIDAGTRLVLEKIQHLEDRLFPSTAQGGAAATKTAVDAAPPPAAQLTRYGGSPTMSRGQTSNFDPGGDDSLLTLPVRHDANADHVYRWPIVQDIIDRGLVESEGSERPSTFPKLCDATDIFLVERSQHSSFVGMESWRLFEPEGLQYFTPLDPRHGFVDMKMALHECSNLVLAYFASTHAFYPIIRHDQVVETLHTVFGSERLQQHEWRDDVRPAHYCVLLMVLCIGSLTITKNVFLPEGPFTPHHSSPDSRPREQRGPANVSLLDSEISGGLDDYLWRKAQLLFGAVSTEDTLEAAQCFTLASVYLGAKGRAVDSDHNIHIAARKCKLIARRETLIHPERPEFSDPFRRLFWAVYVNESDFSSEFSLTPPSGMTLLEEIVPYPSPNDDDTEMNHDFSHRRPPIYTPLPDSLPYDNFSAFQISTSSAIRRFINRTTAVLYNPHESWRKENHTAYATWLHKLACELRSHHEALHKNLPSLLLSTDPSEFWRQIHTGKSTQADDPLDSTRFSNHLWNVARLRGRYFAGLYIINRPLFEYVLLNPHLSDLHPSKTAILDSCRECLVGCSRFVKTFFTEPANCLTNLFATGMATFTMVIILMIATTTPAFRLLLPDEVENVIAMGLQNLRRFSVCVKEFEWHNAELEKLDRARRKINLEGP